VTLRRHPTKIRIDAVRPEIPEPRRVRPRNDQRLPEQRATRGTEKRLEEDILRAKELFDLF